MFLATIELDTFQTGNREKEEKQEHDEGEWKVMASLLMFESAQSVQCTPAALVNFANWISVAHTIPFWRLIENTCKLIHTFEHLWEMLFCLLVFFTLSEVVVVVDCSLRSIWLFKYIDACALVHTLQVTLRRATVDLIYLPGIRCVPLFLRPTTECKRKIHSDEAS